MKPVRKVKRQRKRVRVNWGGGGLAMCSSLKGTYSHRAPCKKRLPEKKRSDEKKRKKKEKGINRPSIKNVRLIGARMTRVCSLREDL